MALTRQMQADEAELVRLVGEYDQVQGWAQWGAISCAHWLADLCGLDLSTAREKVRVARALKTLPQVDAAFGERKLSYAQVRQVTRVATPEDEAEVLAACESVPANQLPRVLAAWSNRRSDPHEVARRQHEARSLTIRTEVDGMVVVTTRFPPEAAARWLALIDAEVARPRRSHASADASSESSDEPCRPSGRTSWAQQRADAQIRLVERLLDRTCEEDPWTLLPQIVVHVRPEGAELDDGTPVLAPVIERMACSGLVRALIHDTAGRPIDASPQRRFPTRRQETVVRARDRCCRFPGCEARRFLHVHHLRPVAAGGPTVVPNLVLLCSHHHHLVHEGGWRLEGTVESLDAVPPGRGPSG